MRCLFFVLVLAVSNGVYSQDRIGKTQGGEHSPSSQEAKGPFSEYIGCMNRTRGRITDGLHLNPNDWSKPSFNKDREPVLFWDQKAGGFYFVTPTVSTFDKAQLFNKPGYTPGMF